MKKESPSPGDAYESRLGSNLRLTVKDVDDMCITCVAQRRIVDRKTGEVSVEDRERVVPREDWHYVIAGYVPAR